jgi:hypothetical protein
VKRTTPSRRILRTILVALLASGSVLAYFLAPVSDDVALFPDSGEGGTAMAVNREYKTAPQSAEIPPIDASAPTVTETATFALG